MLLKYHMFQKYDLVSNQRMSKIDIKIINEHVKKMLVNYFNSRAYAVDVLNE